MISNNIVLYITFLHAYLFNDYTFSTTINQYGEAHLEFILLPIMLTLGCYATYHLLKNTLVTIEHPRDIKAKNYPEMSRSQH